MAIKSLDDIREEAVFGRRLFQLGADLGMSGPAAIAAGLYQNDECFRLVQPRGRTVKYAVNEEKDKESIARTVQRHCDYESPTSVQGGYMLAYSVLFDCSMDYLYGKIEEKCPNVETLDISKKTGLSVDAVKKLEAGEEIFIDDYLQTINNFGLLDGPECGTYDPELDDYFLETNISLSKFWSELIESELFLRLPENWHRMACALYTSSDHITKKELMGE